MTDGEMCLDELPSEVADESAPEPTASDEPTAAELAACADVLRRLQPADLDRPEVAAVASAGDALFRRRILKQKFGEGEVQSFLEKKTGNLKRLKRLEQLMEKVEGKHQSKVREVHECGMNVARVQTMAAIKAACETADAEESFGYTLDVEAVQTRRGERNRGGGARIPRLENGGGSQKAPLV